MLLSSINAANTYPNLYGYDSGYKNSLSSEQDKKVSKIPSASVKKELTSEEQNEINKLKSRDQEVRAHEMAHVAAGGQYVRGSAQYEYQTGPDGKRYAVGGEVSIDTAEVPDNPQATITKMQVVQKAALAPADPSSQDRAVAAQAAQNQASAQQESMKTKGGNPKGNASGLNPGVKKTAYSEKGAFDSANTIPGQLINITA
jgi:hypothetical protein